MENKSAASISSSERRRGNRLQINKKPIKKLTTRQNDVYITLKSNYRVQYKHCEDLLNSGLKEIYLHCMGNAVNRAINLALNLIQNSNNTLSYAINTSTVEAIDELRPLCDEEDLRFQLRKNSAVHIKILRKNALDIDCVY